MEKVNVIWEDETCGHIHIYVSLDHRRDVVVLFVCPRTLSVIRMY